MTTFRPAASAAAGGVATRPTASTAARAVMTARRTVRWLDARWAPRGDTGNALASSPPESRAWGTATVVGAADGGGARAQRGARARDAWDGGRSGEPIVGGADGRTTDAGSSTG